MAAGKGIKFTKMEGIGNDYVYIDARKEAPRNLKKLAQEISDRHYGIGGDGLILIRKSRLKGVKHRMQMFNSDGSESEMCGNGLRCVAKYLYDRNLERKEEFPIETGNGPLTVKVYPKKGSHEARRVRINMGEPKLTRAGIPMNGDPEAQVISMPVTVAGREFLITGVGMGNPHCVIFLDEPADDQLVHLYGPMFEHHELFPNRTNVEFVWKEKGGKGSAKVLHQRTWERGAGETLACGTGASAVCVAAALNGVSDRKVKIKLLGGELEMQWSKKDNCVYKTGPAREVFTGVWPA